jgi:PadR family transcriptional regulator, regulatory protein PadR
LKGGLALNIQFKKGVLELCVLALLKVRDWYGYEMVMEICKHFDMSEGSIYPLLRRLMTEGYFTTYLKESSEGPPRKYYKLTDKGDEFYSGLKKEWMEFAEAVNKIVGGEI